MSKPPRLSVPPRHARRLRELHADPHSKALLDALLLRYRAAGWPREPLADVLSIKPDSLNRRLLRAGQRNAPEPAGIDRYAIPPAPSRPATTRTGLHLTTDELAELRRLRDLSAANSGLVPRDSPIRAAADEFCRRIDELSRRGFSDYYLAHQLDMTPRALEGRLERRGLRTPPPSVAGTSSGMYQNRQVNDPGPRVPSLPRAEREQLRKSWARLGEEGLDASEREQAAIELTALLDRNRGQFTVANLAAAMRVRYGALRDFLAARNRDLAGERAGADRPVAGGTLHRDPS